MSSRREAQFVSLNINWKGSIFMTCMVQILFLEPKVLYKRVCPPVTHSLIDSQTYYRFSILHYISQNNVHRTFWSKYRICVCWFCLHFILTLVMMACLRLLVMMEGGLKVSPPPIFICENKCTVLIFFLLSGSFEDRAIFHVIQLSYDGGALCAHCR